MHIEEAISSIRAEAERDILQCTDFKGIEALKIKYLGRKGCVQELMLSLKESEPEKRPLLGKAINDLKSSLTQALDATASRFESAELEKRLEGETIDVSLPGHRRWMGRKHVLLKLLDEAIDVLVGMGFSVQYGPDIESDYYNFEALNFSKDHPARDMQDTFYLSPDILLRTHTSNTQVRVMEACKPPIRVIAPGKCYRSEDVSARSHIQFHQIEILYVDKGVAFTHLFDTLEELFTRLFQQEITIRFRPSYFPFVEPGMEVDINCIACRGAKCNLCKYTGWLEVAGAGMVHPEVLTSGGIDPEDYTGYACGFGIERLALLRYGIKDIRLFMENDVRFLQQF